MPARRIDVEARLREVDELRARLAARDAGETGRLPACPHDPSSSDPRR